MLSSLPVTSNLPAPAPLPSAGNGAAESTPGSFSRALDDAHNAEPEAPPAQGRPMAPGKARGSAEGRHKATERGADLKNSTPPAAPPAADESPAGIGCLAPTAETESTEPEAPAEVSTLLADLQARAPAASTPLAAAGGTAKAGPVTQPEAEAGPGKTPALDTLRGPVQGRQIDLPSPPADRRAGAALPMRPEPAPAAEAPAAAASSATERLASAAASLHTETPLPVAPVVAPPVAATTAGTRPAEVAQAAVAAHPASAEFAPQLGATLATFVREGVEHARLQLHPAELGPVQVQIQLEGSNAQVMMGADHPLTRQALEQSLPMLAAALREAGLTLAGGGVFEQARQGNGNPAGEGRSDGRQGGRSTGDAEAPPVRLPPPRSRGVVDLVA